MSRTYVLPARRRLASHVLFAMVFGVTAAAAMNVRPPDIQWFVDRVASACWAGRHRGDIGRMEP